MVAQVDGVLGSGGRGADSGRWGAGLRWTGCWTQVDGMLDSGGQGAGLR